MADRQIEDVKKRHAGQLLSLPSVLGVAIEQDPSGRSYIAVYADPAAPPPKVPTELEGYPVRLVATGRFRPL